MEGSRGGAAAASADAGSGKGSNGNAGAAKMGGVPNKAALLRAAERKKRLESGSRPRSRGGAQPVFRPAPVLEHLEARHALLLERRRRRRRRPGPKLRVVHARVHRSAQASFRQLDSAKPPIRRPGSAAPRAPGAPAAATEGPTRQRIRHVRARLQERSSNLTASERAKLVASLPPHEQIVALARGLDASHSPNETRARPGPAIPKRDSARTPRRACAARSCGSRRACAPRWRPRWSARTTRARRRRGASATT